MCISKLKHSAAKLSGKAHKTTHFYTRSGTLHLECHFERKISSQRHVGERRQAGKVQVHNLAIWERVRRNLISLSFSSFRLLTGNKIGRKICERQRDKKLNAHQNEKRFPSERESSHLGRGRPQDCFHGSNQKKVNRGRKRRE